jgi:light-regulated signal transduction histidine kinase (bacteriophytochrome)
MIPKILLVDDREDNLLSIETILETDGYRFAKANSGREVLKILLTEFDFALILMDVKMPNLDGFETASLIYEREKLRHIPIIFITANNYGEENVFKGYRAGAVDYIYKPINSALLRAKVAVLVDLYKKNHRLVAQEQKLVAINKSLQMEIKDRKASEEQVIELNRQLLENIDRLESANNELDTFAFMASHDLQAPLRKIRIFSDRLLSESTSQLDEEGKMYLNRIQLICIGMQELINDILKFSKISGENDLFEQVDLNQVLEELVSEMDATVTEKKAKIVIDPLPSLFVNRSLMRPLFSNLIGNALKYSKKEVAPIIQIRCETSIDVQDANKKETSGRYCRIFIEDNGLGFEQKYAEQIFEMFRRLRSNADGTGIGLALCKRIVEKHNGFISARSKVNEGSTFIVSLPLVPG